MEDNYRKDTWMISTTIPMESRSSINPFERKYLCSSFTNRTHRFRKLCMAGRSRQLWIWHNCHPGHWHRSWCRKRFRGSPCFRRHPRAAIYPSLATWFLCSMPSALLRTLILFRFLFLWYLYKDQLQILCLFGCCNHLVLLRIHAQVDRFSRAFALHFFITDFTILSDDQP